MFMNTKESLTLDDTASLMREFGGFDEQIYQERRRQVDNKTYTAGHGPLHTKRVVVWSQMDTEGNFSDTSVEGLEGYDESFTNNYVWATVIGAIAKKYKVDFGETWRGNVFKSKKSLESYEELKDSISRVELAQTELEKKVSHEVKRILSI